MMRFFSFIIMFVLLAGYSVEKQPLPEVNPQLKKQLIDYIQNNYMTPEEYIMSKFKEHDVVIIGEQHRIKHDVELIQTLIPKLYENGVYFLATEFARREDQYLVDSLLSSDAYDQKLAEKITLLKLVAWGYKEYVDIFKIAWHLNRDLAEGSRKFRILALGGSPDWSFIKTPEDSENDEIKKKVWHGQTEEDWARVILDEVIGRDEKALVCCGINHGFTEYSQPVVDFKNKKLRWYVKNRMGKHVYNEIGKRVVTIYLHAPWVSDEGWNKPPVYPVDGVIDVVIAELPRNYRRAGFDTKGTPFGSLKCTTSYHKYSHEEFKLEMFCDGYIIQKQISEYEGVTVIEDFINEDNIDYARSQAPNPLSRDDSIEDFIDGIKRSADFKKRYAHLH